MHSGFLLPDTENLKFVIGEYNENNPSSGILEDGREKANG